MITINTQKIIAHLRRKGISQNELAKKVGVTGAAISKILNGFKDPSLAVAKRIADYFGTTIDDLVN